MKDYGPQKAAGQRQKIAPRDAGSGRRVTGHTWLWRATGFLAMMVMTIGVGVSLWFGYRINRGLGELAVRQNRLGELQERHGRLEQQRDALLGEARIKAAARKMGLYPPTAGQIKKM